MKKITVALLALISLFTISCEIGLGAAVDTEPPALDIVTPPVDAIIRDNFAIRGTWSDDGAIDTISIKLDRTDGKGSSLEFVGEFVESKDKRGSGTWTAEIPAKSKPVTDGTYQAVVTIKDATGRTTTQSTTFTIDNTPPLLILQRPATDISTTDESSIDTYGKILTLEGRAADDNNIDHIDVKIYSDPGKTNLIHTITLKNVPLSIALDAAKWGDEAYNAIYGNTVEDKKRFYCSIEAYDAAQRYPADGSAQKDADKNGNCANYYYLYNEIASSSIADYKVTELYSVLNGTSSRAATDTKTVKDLLTKLKKGTGQFFLNPKNNPTFKLASWKARETPADEESGFVTFNGAGISIDVEPGLDSYPIDKDSLKVYFIEAEYNSSTTPVIKSGAPKMYLSPDDMDIKGASSYKIAITIDTGKSLCNEAGETVESYKLKTSKDYLVVVEGYDKIGSTRGNPLIPESLSSDLDGYPIHIANAGGAPEVTVTYYKLNSEVNTDSIIYMPKYAVDTETPSVLTLSGTIDFKAPYENASSLDGIEFKVLIDNDEQHPIYTKANLNHEVGSAIYTFTDLAITGTNLGTSDQHELTIYANNGSSAWVRKTVVYDTDGPVVEVSSLTPVAKKYDEDESTDGNFYLNGKVSFKVSFNDAKDIVDTSKRKPKVEFVQGSTIKTIKSGITSLTDTITDADTEQLNSGAVTIRVTAYDRAGNKSVYDVVANDADGSPVAYNTSGTVPSQTRNYIVDQDTDKPYIVLAEETGRTLNNSYEDISSTDPNRKNVFNQRGQLRLKLIDDDGLKSYKLYVIRAENANPSQPANPTISESDISRSGKEHLLSYEFENESPGYYAIWVEVTDKNNKTRKIDDSTTNKPFFVQIAADAPVLTLEAPTYVTTRTANVTADAIKKLSVSIKIDSTECFDSAEGPFHVYMADSTTTDAEIQGAEEITTDGTFTSTAASSTFTYDFVPTKTATGSYKQKFFVKDKNGRASSVPLNYKVDNSLPGTTITSDIPTKFVTSNTFKGTATENDSNDSGVKLVQVTFTTPVNGEVPSADIKNATGTKEWYYDSVYANDLGSEGLNKHIYVRAIDEVGNIGAWSDPQTFDYDIAAPQIDIKLGDDAFESTLTTVKTEAYTFKYKITETHGLKQNETVTVKKNDVVLTGDDAVKVLDEDSDGWKTVRIIDFADATYEYTISATDLADKTTAVTRTVKMDRAAPKITVLTPDFDSYQSSEKITVKGSAEDDSGVLAVWWCLKADNSEPVIPNSNVKEDTSWTAKSWTKAAGTSSWTIPEIEGQERVTKKLYITAVDKNGITHALTAVIVKNFRVDLDPPTFEETTIGEEKVYTKVNYTFAGKVSDTGSDIKSITITDRTKTYKWEKGQTTNDISYNTSTGAWSYTVNVVNVTSTDEGTEIVTYADEKQYDYTLTAKDDADRTTTIYRTVVYDKTPPVIGDVTKDDWYKSKSVTIQLDKDNITETLSKVDSVKATVDPSTAQTRTWVDMPLSNGSYKGTVDFTSDGKDKEIYILVTDKAGNESTEETVKVNIDISDPELEKLKYQVGTGSIKDIGATVYINNTNGIVIYGSYSDGLSGVDELVFEGTKKNENGEYLKPAITYSTESLVANNENKNEVHELSYDAYDEDNATDIKYWKAVIANDQLEDDSTAKLSVTGTNKAGGSKTISLFQVIKDITPPTFTKPKIEPVSTSETESLTVYQDSTSKVYYLNNKLQAFTISGVAEDKVGVDVVEFEIVNTKDTTKKIKKTLASAYLENIKFATMKKDAQGKETTEVDSYWEDGATITITVKDTAGNSSVEVDNITKLHVVFDTKGPYGVHEFDYYGKDLYFRFGESDNDTITSPTLDKDVGGKYSPNSFSKLNTMKIRGAFKDFTKETANTDVIDSTNNGDGSGVDIIYYKVFEHEPSDSELNDYKDEYKSASNSFFSPLKTPEAKTVWYNKNAASRSIKSTYKTTIADLNEGQNYLVLLAIDKVGNVELEKVHYGDNYYSDYKLNVDQTQPVIVTDAKETKYTNADDAYDVTGTYSDPAAWIKEMNFTYASYFAPVTYTAYKVEGVAISGVTGNSNASKINSDDLKDEKYAFLTKDNHARIKITKGTTSSYHDIINDDSPVTSGEIQFTPAIASPSGTYEVEFGNGTWTATIPADTLKSYAGQTKTVSLTAVDNAYNSITEPIVATIVVDRTAPVVSISTPKQNSVLDKTITISGTIEEINGIKELTLTAVCDSDPITKSYSNFVEFDKKSDYAVDKYVIYEGKIYKCKTAYVAKDDTDWKEEKFEDTGFSYNAGTKQWSTKIDTTQLNATGTDKNCTITMTAIDLADNTGSDAKTVKINQDNDRPTLTFTEWTMSPDSENVFGCERESLVFKISDEDGDVDPANVFFQFTDTSKTVPVNGAWISISTTPTNENPEKLEYNENKGTYTISEYKEGQKKLWFMIIDSENTTFISGSASDLNSPKIKDSKTDTTYSSALHLKIDTKKPTVKDVKFTTQKNNSWRNITNIDTEIFGGDAEKGNRTLNFSLYAYDANEDEDDGLTVTITIPTEAGETGVQSTPKLSKVGEGDTLPAGITLSTITDTETGYKLALYTGSITIDDKYVTGSRTCTLTVTEGVNPYTYSFDLNVDNDAPVFTLTSPRATKVNVGDLEIEGTINDKNTGASGASDKIQYAIPPKAKSTALAAALASNQDFDYEDGIEWTEANAGNSLDLIISTEKMTEIIGYPDKDNFDDYKDYVNPTSKLYELPVWLRLEDNYGNYIHDTTSVNILYNADADTPVIEITDPVHDSGINNSEYITMGGKIKISGTASDGVDKIQHVYLQFATETTSNYDSSIIPANKLTDISSITGVTGDKAVEVTLKNHAKSVNWSYELDVLSLETGTRVYARAIAVDEKTTKPLCSAWAVPLCINVENSKPNIRIEGFRRYSAQVTEATQTAADAYEIQREYSKGMYIKTNDGFWYIYGEAYVQTLNEITEITASEDLSFSWNTENPSATTDLTWTETGHVNQKFLIPISKTAEDGLWETNIAVKGKNGTEGKNNNDITLSFIVDNTKPTYTETNSTTPETLGNIKLRKTRNNATDLYAADSTGSKTMKNDQGKATIAGGITESGSGFKRLAFYFTRGTTIYNVMESTSNTATLGGSGTTDPAAANAASDNLPVKTLTGTVASETFTPDTATDITNNKNIRKGGLVKIGYEYRKITKIESGVVTFEPACDEKHQGSNKSVDFVYAMIVDNSNEEANSDGTESSGDGDGMYENYLLSPCTWEANVNSKNIPDGPVQIHCVVFDEAGNANYGWTKTYISNNPPRITSVMLGTDLNADTKYDLDSEFTTFYKNENHSKTTGVDKWDLTAWRDDTETEYWTAKKNLVVIPEFVGGNGAIYYNYSKATGANGTPLTTAAAVARNDASLLKSRIATIIKASDANSLTAGYDLSGLVTEAGNSTGALILEKGDSDAVGSISTSGDFENGNAQKPGINVYRFSFRDSTNGGTVAEDTQWCVLNITMKQDLVDGTKPSGYLKPFYWTSLTDNSVYTSKATVTSIADLEGHIELSEDLPSGNFGQTSGEYDNDAKVSGKIVIKGHVEDETRIGSFTVTFEDVSATATFTAPSTWTISYKKQGTASTSAITGLTLSLDNAAAAVPNQTSHSADWTMIADTTKVMNGKVAETDRTITVSVSDASSNDSESSNVSTKINEYTWSAVSSQPNAEKIYFTDKALTTHAVLEGENATAATAKVYTSGMTPYYKVDVVPYIVDIKTSLSEAYLSDPTTFSRSALGGYPVLRGETGIEITGFNFSNGTDPTVSCGEVTSSSLNSITLSIPDDAISGDFDVTVGTVLSLNNKNSVDVEYNQEPNNNNNKILNNKRSFYVWGSEQKGGDATVRYPTFRVGPNGEEVFSYDLGGTSTYLYKDGTPYLVGTSFTQWYDTVVSIDNSGNLYGLALNGDCASPGSTVTGYCASLYLYPLVSSNISVWAYGDDYVDFNRAGAFAWENTSNGTRYNPNRIQNPKLVTTIDSDGTSYIYSTYYDATEKLIKFRAGNTTSKVYTKSNTTINFTYVEGKGFKGDTVDRSNNYVFINGYYYKLTYASRDARNGNNPRYYYYTISGYQSTSDFTSSIYTKNNTTTTVTDSIGNYSNGTGGSTKSYQEIASDTSASSYSALAVASDGTAIVCWYDSAAKALKLKYNTSPLTGTTWSTAITIDSGLAGWYPDMVVDNGGGIHIAYYGAKNGDLKYAYLSSYTDTIADVCTVDSFLSVGTRASISVSATTKGFKVGNTTVQKYVPFISYYMGAFTATQTSVRTAWPVALGDNKSAIDNSTTSNTYINGAINDQYTGGWEVQTLPLDSFPSDYTIGIGVKATDISTDAAKAAAVKAEGNIILGYGTSAGLETARLY